jgi:hypothetical protein
MHEAAVNERFTLACGCVMDIVREEVSAATSRRAIQRRHPTCRVRTHWPGARVYVWEMLPPRRLPVTGWR